MKRERSLLLDREKEKPTEGRSKKELREAKVSDVERTKNAWRRKIRKEENEEEEQKRKRKAGEEGERKEKKK